MVKASRAAQKKLLNKLEQMRRPQFTSTNGVKGTFHDMHMMKPQLYIDEISCKENVPPKVLHYVF
jgi:hypothetical protein